MTDIVIKVEKLAKLYRLGTVGTGSLKHDMQRWWQTKVKGKEDPFMKVGSLNERGQKADSDYVWSLKDISFEVLRGEALGIIGRNGAGKSTLLKILSRVTSPTTGTVKVKGRIASLLEVGTGFHGELSGKENIFLNGSIMGMSKQEIRKKYDEIVDFSGVERYIDTPVKRYSSGMYVRLAFAVAAYLEPEILIVDEVLAVGDAEFQKKCIGKMHDVSEKQGRTVLFVSHNMQAVQNLCTRAIMLQNGLVIDTGAPNLVINRYLSKVAKNQLEQSWESIDVAPGNEFIKVKSVRLIPMNNNPATIDVRTPLKVKFLFWNLIPDSKIHLTLQLYALTGECVFTIATPAVILGKGLAEGECFIPGNLLNNGKYDISIYVDKDANT
ncbi:MAG: polysaccharide ABC transporter ATP-binding protein, partial [Bacteroidota bacterium]|nr:polysaccharide ABC transporter ATP-binding protein [Bacteroidota bacterium]